MNPLPETTSETVLKTGNDLKQPLQVEMMLDAYRTETKSRSYGIKAQDFATGRAILEADPHLQIAVLFSILSRERNYEFSPLKTVLLARLFPGQPPNSNHS